MILLDTNIVSEFTRPRPSAVVVDWAAKQGAATLGVTAVTVQEIEYGLARMPQGSRRDVLLRSWTTLLGSFADWVFPLDEAAAHATARILARSSAQGRTMNMADGQIAGIAVSQSILATRNIKDFAVVEELHVVDPCERGPA